MSSTRTQYKVNCLPADDRSMLDNWLPNDTEWTASTPELEVLGEIAKELNVAHACEAPQLALQVGEGV